MKRLALFFAIICLTFQARACPACNIHNYLYSSLHNSGTIYLGRVVDTIDEAHARVELVEIIRNRDGRLKESGQMLEQYLYDAAEKVGEEFIFSNPIGPGLSFSVLESELLWEVKYLSDSTSKIETVSQAIRLIEGVSRKSVYDGMEYVKAHYNESFDSLAMRLAQFRQRCLERKEDFFPGYRLNNLAQAILQESNSRTKTLISNELALLRDFDFGNITCDGIRRQYGDLLIGDYIRQLLFSSDKADYCRELVDQCMAVVTTDTTSAVIYFTHALSFENFSVLEKQLSKAKNKEMVVLGLMSAALWYRSNWDRIRIKPVLASIKKLNVDPEVTELMDRMEDF